MKKTAKHKWAAAVCLFAAAVLIMVNTVKLDGKYYFRFSADVFLDNCTNEDAHILETMPFIRRLEIRNCISDNIDFLENKKLLTELSILKYNGDWSPLKSCKKLQSFSSTNSTFDDLTIFSEMDGLEKLNLAVLSYDMQINSQEGIEKLQSLKYLNLNGLKEEALYSLGSLSELESLGLFYCDIENIDIDLEKIRYINLSYNYELKSCSIKNSCIGLKSLTITDCPKIKLDIDELLSLPSLEEITVTKDVLTEKEAELLVQNGISVSIA